ncbi:MAG: hypothetical protein Q4C25_09630 [Bacillota bacterium]|nr:hypothetical protein [Bacillota bacterium]
MQTAIEESIRECRREGILTDFLQRNGGEIMSFLYDALTREECEAIREDDGYRRGKDEGLAEGQRLGLAKGQRLGRLEGIEALILDNLEEGKTTEQILEKLMKRFQLSRREATAYLKKHRDA